MCKLVLQNSYFLPENKTKKNPKNPKQTNEKPKQTKKNKNQNQKRGKSQTLEAAENKMCVLVYQFEF